MNILFSSCRILRIQNDSYIHKINYTHNTKEIIQYIKYINDEINIPYSMEKYIFRGVYLDNNLKIDKIKLQKEFKSSKNVFIEICSRKKYIKNNFYIHHLSADKGDDINNSKEDNIYDEKFKLEIQDFNEIENDILEIINILKDKNVYFITHIDYQDEHYQNEKRLLLINQLCIIFKKYNIKYFNPSNCGLQEHMTGNNHFTSKGLDLLKEYIYNHFKI